jgi:TonB family protein
MHIPTASAVAALMVSSLAAPAHAAPLQPAGQWILDYGDAQCTAARSFGPASAPIVFGVVPSLSGETYQVLVSVPQAGPVFARELAGSLDLGATRISTPLLYYGGEGVAMSVYQARIPAATMERARSVASISVRAGDDRSFTFAVSDLSALLDGLAICTANLQHYWNMRGPSAATAAVRVSGDLRVLVTRAGYPTEALRKGQQGTAQFQVLVDDKGAVAGCDVLVPSGVPVLDSTGCEVISERARFRPARDAQGQPVRSVVTTPQVAWTDASDHQFDNGCMTLAGNTDEIVSMCGRSQMRQHFMVPRRSPPPPPPATQKS